MEKNTGQVVMRLVLKSLFVVMAFIGLSACSLLQGESIDGNWTSPTAAKDMYDEIIKAAGEGVFTYTDHSFAELVTQSEIELDIKDDKAVFEVFIHIDEEAFVNALKEEQEAVVRAEFEKQGLSYDNLTPEEKTQMQAEMQSEDMMRTFISETIGHLAKDMGGSYSAEKGLIQATVFQADVNRGSRVFEIKKVGGAFGKDFVKKGESYQYTYEDGKLTLEGEKDEDDMVFEKKK